MSTKPTKLYPYRIFAGNNTLMALLPFSTLKEVWKAVEENSVMDFIIPKSNGGTIEAIIRTASINAIDRPWGVDPVEQMEGPEPVANVSNRTRMSQGKIILGQTAKRAKK